MQRYAETLERWTTYYERVGIGAMGYGAVLLRRRDTPIYRLRVDDAPPAGINPDAADELQRLLEIEDRLESLDDTALLEQTLGVVPGSRLEQITAWQNGGLRTTDATLTRDQGLRPRASIAPPMAILLSQVDAGRSVSEVIDRTANLIRAQTSETFREEALDVLRQLIVHGFLTIV